MKVLIVYDSAYGNTELIAKAIAKACTGTASGKVVLASDAEIEDARSADLLVIGCPTQGGRPTPAIQAYVDSLSPDIIEHTQLAVFDTRFAKKEHGAGLRVLMGIIGFAAPKLAASLHEKGGDVIIRPEGFIVTDKEGPLKDGELERATRWGVLLLKRARTTADQKVTA